MLANISRVEFLNIVKKKEYSFEKNLEEYCLQFLPDLLKIDKSRIKSQQLTTPFDYTLSNRGDIFIYSENDPDQVIVVIEIKLDKSIKKFNNGSYDKSIKQIHKYCQDLNSPYGVLLSDKQCFIYEYKYNGSTVNPISLNSLPPISEIEKELIKNAKLHDLSKVEKGIEELKEYQKNINKKNNLLKKKIFLFIFIFTIIVSFLTFKFFVKKPNATCDIKGNVSINNGIVTKIYHDKNSPSYNKVIIDKKDGDKMFCTVEEAEKDGFRKWKK